MEARMVIINSLEIFENENAKIINPHNFIPIINFKSISNADEGSLVFIAETSLNKMDLIQTTKAKTIICDVVPDDQRFYKNKCLVISTNSKLLFAKVVNENYKCNLKWGIHPTAIIHPEAKIAKNVFVGAYVTIGRSEVEEGAIIYPNVSIYDNVKIGKNVIIDSGAVIGSAGFGFVKLADGTPFAFPQIGGVIIEDNVEIGANTCIDRGALQDTIIGAYSKIDNLTEIGHNVKIGKKSIITAGVLIGGSCIIGDEGWIAPNVSIKNKSIIGEKVFIGIGSVVIRDINRDQIVFGNPSKAMITPKKR